MSLFPAGFNSPANLTGPCLVKYYYGFSNSAYPSGTMDTLETCTAGSSNYNAIANGNSQYPCDFTSTYPAPGVTPTVACGLIAMNATLTSSGGTYTLYNSATTNTFTATILAGGPLDSIMPDQVVLIPNTASIASFIVQPTSGGAPVAKIPTLIAACGIVVSVFFVGLL